VFLLQGDLAAVQNLLTTTPIDLRDEVLEGFSLEQLHLRIVFPGGMRATAYRRAAQATRHSAISLCAWRQYQPSQLGAVQRDPWLFQ
jgi:hypothetical protein